MLKTIMSTVTLRSDENGAELPEAINVLIAYDDLAAAQRAMRLFTRIGRGELDDLQTGDLLCQPQLWPFDLLTDADWRKCAAADALRADLIVVSASSSSALPRAVQTWLTASLVHKQGAHAAVVALLSMGMESSNSCNLRFLKGAATEAGLDFFVALRDPDALPEDPASKPAEEEVAESFPRDEQFPEARWLAQPRNCYREWGIND